MAQPFIMNNKEQQQQQDGNCLGWEEEDDVDILVLFASL